MYVVLVALHIFAAMSWVGGMLFLSLVLAPIVKSRKAAPEFMALFRSAARRFRIVAWVAMGLLLTSGPMLLAHRGMGLTHPESWPFIVSLKLGLVVLLLVLTLLHDLLLGPRVSHVATIPASSRTGWDQIVMHTARLLPRFSLIVALGVVLTAVILARS